MADHKISRMTAAATRRAQKNLLLNQASAEAMPWMAAGNIPEALNVLNGYSMRVGRIIDQERLYAAEDNGGTK